MARGIVIPFTADIRQWGTAIRSIGKDLDDTTDALDDIRRAGDRAAEAVEDDLTDAADDAEDAFGDLARSARRDLGRVGDAADSAERDVDDLTDEAANSAREFGSAFRGDPVEALEEVQSLASELATRFVPGIGGAVLAVTGGVAFSALIGFYERWKEEQEAINERVRGYRDTVLDAFGVLEKSTVADAFTDALDRAGIDAAEFEAIMARAPENLRVGFRQALQAGDLQGLLDITGQVQAAAQNINRTFVAQGAALTPGQQAILDMNRALGGTTGELADGVADAQALARLLGNDADAADDVADAMDGWSDPLRAANETARAIDGTIRGVEDEALGLSRGALRDLRDRLREADTAAGNIKRNVLGIPTDVAVNVTLNARAQAANAKAQRLLDAGVID